MLYYKPLQKLMAQNNNHFLSHSSVSQKCWVGSAGLCHASAVRYGLSRLFCFWLGLLPGPSLGWENWVICSALHVLSPSSKWDRQRQASKWERGCLQGLEWADGNVWNGLWVKVSHKPSQELSCRKTDSTSWLEELQSHIAKMWIQEGTEYVDIWLSIYHHYLVWDVVVLVKV